MAERICPETGHPMARDVRPIVLKYKGRSRTVKMPGWYCGHCDEGVHTWKDMAVSGRALNRMKVEAYILQLPAKFMTACKSLLYSVSDPRSWALNSQTHMGLVVTVPVGLFLVLALAFFASTTQQQNDLAVVETSGQNKRIEQVLGNLADEGFNLAIINPELVDESQWGTLSEIVNNKHDIHKMPQYTAMRVQIDTVKEWQTLAETGNPIAQFNLGNLHISGYRVQKNNTEAATWYKAAAMQGLPEAQHNLGIMYETGLGVPKNSTGAYVWYYIATENGLSQTTTLRDRAENSLSADQLLEAKKIYTRCITTSYRSCP